MVMLMPPTGMGAGGEGGGGLGGGGGALPHMAPLYFISSAGTGLFIQSISWVMVTQ